MRRAEAIRRLSEALRQVREETAYRVAMQRELNELAYFSGSEEVSDAAMRVLAVGKAAFKREVMR